jgi:2-succinyl-5-enolpyruvyl-6-hydroxy-3-cyclohexene-1-carboxylate synthase
VHLNLAFREPLVGNASPLPPGRLGGAPWQATADPGVLGATVDTAWAGRRGVLIVGARSGPPEAIEALAARLGWPVFADPRSRARRCGQSVVAAADELVRVAQLRTTLRPEVVIQIGEPWISKPLGTFIAEASESGAQIVRVDPWWRWQDPDQLVALWVRADPERWVHDAVGAFAGCLQAPSEWVRSWLEADARAQDAIDHLLEDDEDRRHGALCEPAVARLLFGELDPQTQVMVSSSMPVRDLEAYAPVLASPPAVFANRGVNGIDGVCSTAQGIAAATGSAVVALMGDLAFLHDVSSLLAPHHGGALGAGCTVVVLDNRGGGIFDFLGQAHTVVPESFEALFSTPHDVDIVGVCEGFGLPCADVTTASQLRLALNDFVGTQRLSVVRVRMPERSENVAIHERIHRAVAAALER